MSRISARSALLLLGFVVACATSSARIREGFVGMSGRHLQHCVGPAHELVIRDDVELLTYRWAWSNPTTGVEITGLEHNPRMMVGSYHAHDKPMGGYCVYEFRLRGGRVESFDVSGRTHQDLNADGDCLRRIGWCLEED
ncbi:MAG: hypothetical protein V3V67_10935 [Myxococcota bacterium]